VRDCFGYDVAIGHVITGIGAGRRWDHSLDHLAEAAKRQGRDYTAAVVKNMPMGERVDNIYSLTIAGDLGQSASLINEGKQTNFIGPGTEATYSELVGDIDGLIMGQGTSGTLSDKEKLSSYLSGYYCVDYLADGLPNAARRFNTFKSDLKAGGGKLLRESKRFSTNYNYRRQWKSLIWPGLLGLTPGNVEDVYNKFVEWLEAEAKTESKRTQDYMLELNKFSQNTD